MLLLEMCVFQMTFTNVLLHFILRKQEGKDTLEENPDSRGDTIVEYSGLIIVVVCNPMKNIKLENTEACHL